MKGTAEALTKRQASILEFIRAEIRGKGIVPTLHEIGGRFGIRSPNGVRGHLLALERKGRIRRDAHRSRAIQLLSGSTPLVARIAPERSADWRKTHCYSYVRL